MLKRYEMSSALPVPKFLRKRASFGLVVLTVSQTIPVVTIRVPLLIFCCLIAVTMLRRSIRLSIPISVLLLLLSIGMSIGTSLDPSTSLFALGQVVLIMFAIIVYISYLEPSQILSALVVSVKLVIFAVVILELSSGGTVVTAFSGVQGYFANPNVLAFFLTISTVILIAKSAKRVFKRLLRYAWIVSTLVLLVATKAESALVYCLVGLVSYIGVSLLSAKSYRKFAGVVFGVIALLTVYVTGLWRTAMNFIGIYADPSLSGRSDIWAVTLEGIREVPLFGYGFQALNDVDLMPNPEIKHLWLSNQFSSFQAHNGYLDTALQVGIPGALFLTIVLLSVFVRNVRFSIVCKSSFWLPALAIIFVSYNLTEVRVFTPSFAWVFLGLIILIPRYHQEVPVNAVSMTRNAH